MDRLVITIAFLAGVACTSRQLVSSQRIGQLSAYKIASFQNPDSDPSAKLNHFILHRPQNSVYVGAVNSVYRLSSTLLLESNASTTSECTDSEDCFNQNKIIFVEPQRNTLITCGSDNSGRCQQHELGNLTITSSRSRSEIPVSPGRDKSTVALLAPGPNNMDYLYVASTYTRESGNAVYPVSRRSLALHLTERLLYADDDSKVDFSSAYRSLTFDINYVYGFASNGFTYFMTNQQQDRNSNGVFVSKLVRICHDSPDLDSYTEIILHCNKGDVSYNLAQAAYLAPSGSAESLGIDSSPMLYAVFSTNIQDTHIPSENSALCAFSIADVDDAFEKAVQNCTQQGSDYIVPYLEGTECPGNPRFQNFKRLLCDAERYYAYANNPVGVSATPLLQLEDAWLTSIIVSVEMSHTIAFVGTAQGSLLKVHIENATHARLYETIKIDDSPVLSDIRLGDQLQQIHILTEQQLVTLKVENCKQYTNCEACIGQSGGHDGDPYCGWCTLQNECSKDIECPMANISRRWLPYNAAQCVSISDINPDNLPVTAPQQMITLTVEALPALSHQQTYSCQFNNLTSPGVVNDNIVQCFTPVTSALPTIPDKEDHVTLLLSVLSSETSVNFITTTFTYYDCARHTSCTKCVTSEWNCDWCVYDNLCTHQSYDCTQVHVDSIITGNNNPVATAHQGPEFCPQLQSQTREELVPVGMARQILVSAANLPQSSQSVQMDYKCSLMVEGTKQTTTGTRLTDDVIQCNSQMYTYKADKQELVVSLTITWNGDWQLDDIDGFKVTLYKCEVDRLDCSRCLSNLTCRPELECRWCSGQCAFKGDPVCDISALNPSHPCPAPDLTQVYPATGPTEGNTIIEITGTDIGRRGQDILSVMVGGQACDLTGLKDHYVVGESVRCRTASMSAGDAQLITVTVATVVGADRLTSTGNVEFTYQNPVITSFMPRMGPEDGGTEITITGIHMDTGRDIRAMIANNVQCDIDRDSISSTAIECRTGNSTEGSFGPVLVIFDGAVKNSLEVFTYQTNPTVTDITPRQSIQLGGRNVTVIGANLEQIQNPQIISTLERNDISKTFKEQCITTSDTHMTCKTPDISSGLGSSGDSARRKRQAVPSPVIGFIMDDVSGLLRWSETQAPPDFEFQYVANPTFEPFPGDDKILELEGTKLTIRGEQLNNAQTRNEVRVLIGTEDCAIEIFDNTILTCEAPITKPEPLDYDGNRTDTLLPAVYVLHSSHYFFIGYIQYTASVEIVLYIAIAAAVVLLPLVLVALFLWRKLRGSQKEVSTILIQMEEVEKGMAEDLRIAFAELQTNVTDLTHDLTGTGMPFVSHRQYTANMLFIGLDIQPQTSDPHDKVERAMAQFNNLLAKKTFLLAFIQALDDNKKIPIKDKATIASLLTVIMMLEDKLGYLTDIMMTLMSSQVQQAVDNNRPKQLFRRTESIVEKLLSNWIALCLYDQLKDHTAFPLFLLYSGIKVQTEKGPVDGITRQAHFSLSEERMLKECVEFKEMTLHVVVDNEDGEEKEVKVLDVDSIPQVKEKILDSMYRNKPYSDRQRAVDVNIEWRQGKSGRLPLKDVAQPPMASGDGKEKEKWQKLNTLAELGVTDNSLMALVPKQLPHMSMNEAISGTASKDVRQDQQDVDLEDGIMTWHLEKPQEDIEETEKQKKKRQREILQGKGMKSHNYNITFPRLLTMKGIVQEYVDKMFQAILTVEGTPLAIKYLFDFFDSQASHHGIEDPDIVHIWKSNTLPLRFWVSAITHPNYIFDIRPTPSIESSLGVVGQAFYDACNKSDHQLGWESSFNKLLYNREVSKYRDLVKSFYEGIGEMKCVTSSDLEKELDKTCQNFTGLFSKQSTLLQLYEFTKDHKGLLMNAMEEDEVCEKDSLAFELEQIEVLLEEADNPS